MSFLLRNRGMLHRCYIITMKNAANDNNSHIFVLARGTAAYVLGTAAYTLGVPAHNAEVPPLMFGEKYILFYYCR